MPGLVWSGLAFARLVCVVLSCLVSYRGLVLCAVCLSSLDNPNPHSNPFFLLTNGQPGNYVAGLGRGAIGFTTRSDIGPARHQPLGADGGDVAPPILAGVEL